MPAPISDVLANFVGTQRSLLVRLEEFSQTPDYARLLETLKTYSSEDPEAWLAEWLISPAYGLGALPIDVAADRDGIQRLIIQLARIFSGTGL